MTSVRRAVPWTLLAGWAALVWLASSRSHPQSDLALPFDVPDKVAHGIEFAVGGFLAREALGSARSPFLAAVLLCAVWGFVDEIHQGFVPGRETDPWDLAADVTGATLGAAIHVLARGRADRWARSSR